jgi:hypothetical protein
MQRRAAKAQENDEATATSPSRAGDLPLFGLLRPNSATDLPRHEPGTAGLACG